MIEFLSFNESLNNPYSATLRQVNGERYQSTFKVDDGSSVTVDFKGDEHIDDYDHLDWTISFSRNGSQATTGEGDALRIIATVMKMIKEFVKKEDPKYMTLSAAKEQRAGQKKMIKQMQGREKVYNRLVKNSVGSKYKVTSDTGSSGTIWYISKVRR